MELNIKFIKILSLISYKNKYLISLAVLIFSNTLAISKINRFYFIAFLMLFFFLTINNCWTFIKKENSIFYVFASVIFIVSPSCFGFWGGMNPLKALALIYISIYLMYLVDYLYDMSFEKIDFIKTVAHATLFLYIIYYLSDIVLKSFFLNNFSPPLMSVFVPISIAVLYLPTEILFFTTCSLIVAFINNDRAGVLICAVTLIYFYLDKSKFAINKKLFLSSIIFFPFIYIILVIVVGNLFDISKITTNRSDIAVYWWKLFISYPEFLLSGFGDNNGYALIFSKNNSSSGFSDYSQPHNIVLGEIIRMGLLNTLFFFYLALRMIINCDLHRFMVPPLLFLTITFSFGGPSNLIAFHPFNVMFFLLFLSVLKVSKSS